MSALSLRGLAVPAVAIASFASAPELAHAGPYDGYIRGALTTPATRDLPCRAENIVTRCTNQACTEGEAAGCGRIARYMYRGNAWVLIAPVASIPAPAPAPPPPAAPPPNGPASGNSWDSTVQSALPSKAADQIGCPAEQIVAKCTNTECSDAEATGCGRTARYHYRWFHWTLVDADSPPPQPEQRAPAGGYYPPSNSTYSQSPGYGQSPAPQAPSYNYPTPANNRAPAAYADDSSAAPVGRIVAGAPQPLAYAVVVGIEHYPSLPSPVGARSDAERFADVARRTLGVPPAQMRVLFDGEASRGRIEREIAWVSGNVPPGGRIYFYFSGHGAPDPVKGTSYLVPSDGDPQYLPNTALTLDSVVQHLRTSKAKDVVVFTDACFSGSGGRSVLAPGARPIVRMKSVATPGNVVMFSASGGEEISGPTADGKSGLFSWHLLQGLASGKADMNGDGQITLEELANYVSPRVTREAARANRAQHPALKSGDKATKPAQMMLVWGLEPS